MSNWGVSHSWWRLFTEALCNSRGYQTDWQKTAASMKVMKDIKRDMLLSCFKHQSWATPAVPEAEISTYPYGGYRPHGERPGEQP